MRRRYFLLILVLFFADASAQDLPARIPYVDSNGKWGYCKPNGEIKIVPQWMHVEFFVEGRARVGFDEGAGFCVIDTNGSYIIPPELHWNGYWGGWNKATMNVRDGAGHWGVADSNGHVIIPLQYEPYSGYQGEQFLSEDNLWHKQALLCKKNGKAGIVDTAGDVLIPFVYDQINMNIFSYLSKDLIMVNGSGRSDIINAVTGQSVLHRTYAAVLFDTSDSKGIRVMDSDKFGYISYPSFKEVMPCRYKWLQKESGYFVVSTEKGYGVMDSNWQVVIPFSYTGIHVKGGVAEVEKTEDVPIAPGESPNGPVSVKGKEGYKSVTYKRSLDIHTLQPLTEWVEQRGPMQQMHCCYTEHLMRQNDAERRAHKDPTVVYNGQNVNTFNKDGVKWWVQRNETNAGRYAIVTHSAHDTTWYAVADRTGNFLTRPYRGEIMSFNTGDGLVTVRRNGRFGVLDTQLKMVVQFQRRQISYGLRWKGKVYAVVYDHAGVKEDNRELVGLDINDPGIYIDESPGTTERQIDKRGVLCIMGSDTQIVTRFRGYRIEGLADERWTRTWNELSPCFWVQNATGHMGLLSPLGKVLMPEISFKYKALSPVGDGLFLCFKNDEIGTAMSGRLYNEHNQPLFPGLTIPQVEGAMIRITGNNGSNFYISNEQTIPHLYYVRYESSTGKKGEFYMNKDGHAYAEGVN